MKRSKKNSASKKMLKYFETIKGYLLLLTFFLAIIVLIGILNPIVTAKLLTSLTEFNVDNIIKYALLFSAIMVLKTVVTMIHDSIFLKKIKANLMLNIRKDMIKNIFKMKITNFDSHSSGEFSERLKNDPEEIAGIFAVVEYSSISMLGDFFILIYIYFINIPIGIVYTLCVLSIFIYEKYAFKKYEELANERKKVMDKSSTVLNELVRGIRDVKVLNISKKVFSIVSDTLQKTTNTENDLRVKNNNIHNSIAYIQIFFTFIITMLSVFLVQKDALTVTNLLVLYMYRTNIFSLVLDYTTIKEYLVNFKVSSERIFEIIDNEKFSKETFGKKHIKNLKGKIEIKDLDFKYTDKNVLQKINLSINPKDTIAFVGASGSGKTTLLNLINKSYDVPDGKIFIDGIDINELDEESIRDNISVITQNPYIFNLTIKENLKLMGNKVTDKQIKEACKIAQIDEYIESLPDKYDTLLGEGGLNLSGGQRQRLTIARALIKNSKIILFDEATSALDNKTQKDLQMAINNMSKDYTMIIVAHRLSTIKDCNPIYIIDKGKIKDSGTHEELLLRNKEYKKLYESEK